MPTKLGSGISLQIRYGKKFTKRMVGDMVRLWRTS